VTTTAEAAVQDQQEQGTVLKPRLGEWVISAVLLVYFAFGYLAAEEWPFRAALFPQMISGAGLVLTVLKLAGLTLQTVRGVRAPVAGPTVAQAPAAAVETVDRPTDTTSSASAGAGIETTSDLTLVDDDAEEDESMEYVFATAGGRAWAEALAWIVGFFVAFAVLGTFITVPLFALVYLRFAGKASWLSAAIYALVTGGLIYVVFRQVVYLPLPSGVFPFLQF
jgi:hypothetical protein